MTSSGRHAQTYNTRVQSKERSLANLAAASATCQPAATARHSQARRGAHPPQDAGVGVPAYTPKTSSARQRRARVWYGWVGGWVAGRRHRPPSPFFGPLRHRSFLRRLLRAPDGRTTMSNASSTSSGDTLMTAHLANNVRSHTSHCTPRPPLAVGGPQRPDSVTLRSL